MSKENIVVSYRFEELAKEVQEKTLDRYRLFNTEYDGWFDFTLEYWKEKLEEIGFTEAKIYFSGFSNQGDGAVFEADLDHRKLLNSLIMCSSKKTGLQAEQCSLLYESGLIYFEIKRTSNANYYSHGKTAYLDIGGIWSDKVADSAYWDTIIKGTQEALEELRLDLCKQIYKDLEQEYYYLTSDEAIRETFEANDYEFLKDGRIFN